MRIPLLRCIVKESLSDNRSTAKCIPKTINTFKHEVCVSFEVSKIIHSKKEKQLVGIE